MRRIALIALVLGVAFAAAPAQAQIVSAQDAAELAQTLAEAQGDQDVCYGWNVTNNFSGSSDVGSSTSGPGVALVPMPATCPKGAVILQGDIDYACGSCESSDSASISISSNLPDPPTVGDLEGLGLKAGALTGDDDDTTLVNMVNALPLLVADRGNAPYVEYEPTTTVPAADHATDRPGSDLLRDSWLGLLFFGGLVLAGPGLYFYKRSQRPSRPATRPAAAQAAAAPRADSTGPPAPDSRADLNPPADAPASEPGYWPDADPPADAPASEPPPSRPPPT